MTGASTTRNSPKPPPGSGSGTTTPLRVSPGRASSGAAARRAAIEPERAVGLRDDVPRPGRPDRRLGDVRPEAGDGLRLHGRSGEQGEEEGAPASQGERVRTGHGVGSARAGQGRVKDARNAAAR